MFGMPKLGRTLLLAASIAVGTSSAIGGSLPNWTVVRDNTGQSVRLVVDQPIPVRSAEPVLIIDDKEVPATVSLDRRTLTAPLDPEFKGTIKHVEQGWRGEAQLRAARAIQSAQPVRKKRDLEAISPRLPPPRFAASGASMPNPLSPGPYAVTRADYDFGDEVVPIMSGPIRVERTAAVYLPANAPGKLPVVVFQHGMHGWCSFRGIRPWPCPAGSQKIQSYRGYDMAANALASQGYAVVSISENGINAYDDSGELARNYGSGYEARAWLILEHLYFLSQANAGTVPQLAALTGRLDLDRVGLMGHSRGGEAVTRAVQMNASRKSPFGIRALLPLAPTTFDKRTTIPDLPTATILPYCDGDLQQLPGQAYQDDSRYAFPDSVLRSSILLMGGNHNFFNEMWSPPNLGGSDDATASNAYPNDPICGAEAPGRLDALTQRKWGSAYIAAFFRMTLGGEVSFLPLFDGSGVRLPDLANVEARIAAVSPGNSRRDIARFTEALPAGVNGLSNPGVTVSLCGTHNIRQCSIPPNYRTPSQQSFDSTVARVTWTVPDAYLTIPLASNDSDTSAFRWLSFRTTPALMQSQFQDLRVILTDRAGRRSNPMRLADYSDALAPVLPFVMPTLWLQTVRLPLSDFAGVDLRNLSAVQFQASSADFYLSDVAFANSSVGTAKITSLPSISALGVNATSGNLLYLTLSSSSSLPVTVHLPDKFAPNSVTIRAGGLCLAVPASFLPSSSPWIRIGYTRNAYPAVGMGTFGPDLGQGAELARYCNSIR